MAAMTFVSVSEYLARKQRECAYLETYKWSESILLNGIIKTMCNRIPILCRIYVLIEYWNTFLTSTA